MDGILDYLLTVTFTVELIIGILGNGFIVLVNIIDWVKRRKLSAVDCILTALAISRMVLLWLVLLIIRVSLQYSGVVMMTTMLKMVTLPWIISNHFSTWLGTCLSLFYFLKIANFSNSLFHYLKWRVKKVVLVTLLLSLVLLVLNTVLMNWSIDVWLGGYEGTLPHDFFSNITVQFHRFNLYFNIIFISIPHALSQSICLLLIFSLCKHLRNMKHSIHSCLDTSTSAHIKALETIITSVLLCLIIFLVSIMPFWNFGLIENSLYSNFSQVIAVAFPAFHSCVLIRGDAKLRRASLSVLWWPRDRHKEMEASGH